MRTPLLPTLTLFLPTLALAQAGSLDGTFGEAGKVVLTYGFNAAATAVAVQPDGNILVAGRNVVTLGNWNFAVARFHADGTQDNTFGTDGQTSTALGNGSDDTGAGMVLQPDGKIIVGGTSDQHFALVRYNADGTLDNTFSGDGILTVPVGQADEGTAVALQADGRILICGTTDGNMAVLRCDPDGNMDASFGGGDGTVTTVTAGNVGRAAAMAVQPDGKIVVTGYALLGELWAFCTVRYNTDGTLDGSFGDNGIATDIPAANGGEANAIALQDDGRILVAGYATVDGSNYDFGTARYNPDGTLDNSFGTAGVTLTDLSGAYDQAWALCVQPDGKILVGGEATNAAANTDFAVVRYTATGALDNTFGSSGHVLTDLNGDNDTGLALALQTDGRILLAGGQGWNEDIAVVRYLNDLHLGIVDHAAATTATLVYPDPLGDALTLEYELTAAGNVRLELIDAEGRTVRVLQDAHRSNGHHRETYDLAGLAAGRYTLAITTSAGRSGVQLVKQ